MKKSLLQIITLALVVVNLVLSVVLVLVCMPAISRTSTLVNKVCEIIDLDVTGVQGENEVGIEDLVEVPITFSGDTETTLNLMPGSDGKQHVLLVSATIVLNKANKDYESKSVAIDSAMGMIGDKIIDVLSAHTMEDTKNSKAQIRQEILGELRQMFNSDFIYDVSFPQFISQ